MKSRRDTEEAGRAAAPDDSAIRPPGDGPPGAGQPHANAVTAARPAVAAGAGAPRRIRDRLLYPGLPLAAVMALAVFLRFWELTAVGFNTDEAVYTGSAASVAGNATLAGMFPVFRAHPLLFQTLLSLVLRVHESDWTARAFAAAIGVATVGVTFLLGRKLYGTVAGLLAGLLLAVMPYHLVVSRQVLLDGLMTLCATAALYCVVRYVETWRLSWLLAAGGMLGGAILSKETSAVLLGGVYAFFVLTPSARLRVRHLLLTSLLIMAVVAVWPVMLRLAGHTRTGQSYLFWQLFRRPNHGTWFYFTVLPGWVGAGLLTAAGAGLVWLRREATWRERLLLAWIIVPLLFFTLWPVKGFQYLLPISPPLAILAGRTLGRPLPVPGWLSRWAGGAPGRLRRGWPAWLARPQNLAGLGMGVLATATAASLLIPAWTRIQPSTRLNTLAGTGGMTGGRQAGDWILRHVPRGSGILAIGPSTANVLEFYGHHQVSALSVSANPHDRNPSYTPVINPSLAVAHGGFQYIVWDAYTAAHSEFFSAEALRLAQKFHGVLVYTSPRAVQVPSQPHAVEPVIMIYEVRP